MICSDVVCVRVRVRWVGDEAQAWRGARVMVQAIGRMKTPASQTAANLLTGAEVRVFVVMMMNWIRSWMFVWQSRDTTAVSIEVPLSVYQLNQYKHHFFVLLEQ